MTFRSQNPSGFRFPPEISCSKEDLPDAPAYVFRHQTLGLLGRIVLRDSPRGRTHITSEVAGDPLDPYTAQRMAVLEPITRQILRRLEEIQGAAQPEAEREKAQHTPSFGESKERIASQLVPCDRCAKHVAPADPRSRRDRCRTF
ncbi:hypothetical protein HDF16_005987 [Granulicella aggregans]|uniref:Uncharacterized protein n=1 Tax=Granulicella aggregans TaxID=474949 RepID=A0A7W7ZJV4_9BACT|nr:hypothetical protein [Granulicella aggregans]